MTLRDYLNVIRRRWSTILATIVLVTLSTLFFSFRQVPIYSATTRMLVKPIAPGTEAGKNIGERSGVLGGINTEAEIVRSENIATRVIDKLELDAKTEEILSQMQVIPSGYTAVLLVTASSPDRQLAKKTADTFAQEYIAYTKDRALEEARAASAEDTRKRDTAEKRLAEVETQLNASRPGTTQQTLLLLEQSQLVERVESANISIAQYLDEANLQRGVGEIIQVAPVPAGATSPNHVRNGILGMLVAIPLAIGISLLRDSLSDTIKSKEEAESLSGAPTLALIPYDHEWRDPEEPYLASVEDPGSPFAEAYRTLRVNIEYANRETPARFVLITSPGRSEGKTVTAANLGIAFSEAGRKTVVVETDLRNPRLGEFLDADSEPGLYDVLHGDGAPGWLQAIGPNLWFVGAGADDGVMDLRIDRNELEALFGVVAEPAEEGKPRSKRASTAQTDMVLLDTPPVLQASEASSLSSVVDGVVLVVHAGITRRSAVSRAAEQIRNVGGTVLGVALVGADANEGLAQDRMGSPVDVVRGAWDRVLDTLRR